MKGKKITSILVIAVLLLTTLAIAVNALPAEYIDESGAGTATWVKTEAYNGDWSIELHAGADNADVGRTTYLPITPILLQDLDEDPTYWVYAETIGGGGEFPLVTVLPYGYPYVNIKLDLDGDLIGTPGDTDVLEAIGSSAGGLKTGDAGVPPIAETWTEMSEAWGYYDNSDAMSPGFSGPLVVHTLTEWKTELATAHPNAKVVGISLLFGYWTDTYLPVPDVYIDDITIGGVTYPLEPIVLDAEFYKTGDTVIVTVADAYANDDSLALDEVIVKATSGADVLGDDYIALIETGANTGLFIGSFTILGAPPVDREANEIIVSTDDTISVVYLGTGFTDSADVDEVAPSVTDLFPADDALIGNTTIVSAAVSDTNFKLAWMSVDGIIRDSCTEEDTLSSQ